MNKAGFILSHLRFAGANFRRGSWAYIWVSGLILGWISAFAFRLSRDVLADLVVSDAYRFQHVLFSLSIPLVFSAIAVLLFGAGAMLPVIGLKAFSYAYCSFGIVHAFGDSGWLASLLFMFSDHLYAPVLLWFWQRAGKKCYSMADDLLLCISLAVAVGTMDTCLITPMFIRVLGSF